ncbi:MULTISPECIES: proline iminopeptidase-family hydrolase [Actinosynnema]|uniref:proline iminopeptidase-family hydrolase n=1 Tax=Actinosynnema TaxID=40566 RepID=UPI0020A37E1E|nr:proline iminopeptidase-family hydrolase [Actinosynnema pretiosum]MCP2092279.1 L-proline amide hydrolase [Actinosynnema pretiosum]
MVPSAKGAVPFGPYRTWYRVTGDLDGDRPPVVAVHGGPGSTHDYLLPLTRLVDDGWPVVHYDQLGNGGSTHLRDRGGDFWTSELFLDELENLLEALGIADRNVLFGQSWGGVLVAEWAARRPEGLEGLVIANAPASYPLWIEELAELRKTLPPVVNERLLRHEAAGTTDSAEYRSASEVFYRRHVCRVQPVPAELEASLLEISADPTVYGTMNGPNEFHITGTLKDHSVIPLLPNITAPTLVLRGEHDEITEGATAPFHELIPGARYEVIPDSSHLPHAENPEHFHRVLLEFLKGL